VIWLSFWTMLFVGQIKGALPSPPPPPSLEIGSFHGGVYRNEQIGLAYEVPIKVKNLVTYTPDERLVKKGKLHTHPWISLATSSGLERPSEMATITIYFDAYYGSSADAREHLSKVTKYESNSAAQVLNSLVDFTVRNQTFYRTDIRRIIRIPNSSQNPGYYTWLCTVWKGYLIEFAFAALDKDRLSQLVGSLDTLELTDPARP
jgi:hypothetical protein